MTIVSGPDHRNADWANDTSNFGQKMLLKMGWSKGKGLGKNEQGTNDNLRAIRREEGLGIGAKTDTLGEVGFSSTSRNFHGVLATLREEHGDTSSRSSKKKSKKSKKKSKEKKKDDTSNSSGLTLSTRRVTAGHAAKMRDAKDLSKKSKEDMAAIFGMKVQDYQTNSVWGKLSSLSSSNNASETEEEKQETVEKKRKRKKELSDVDTNASTVDIKTQEKDRKKKDKKKRKRTEESISSSDEGKKKKKKKKSKKA